MRRLLLVLAALVAMSLGACGDDGDDNADTGSGGDTTAPEQSAEAVSVDVKASEYKFEMASEVTGNVFAFDLDNVGKEGHIAVVTKLAAGKTMADLQKGDPTALEMIGGVASVDPGGKGNATFEVEPGSYIMGCFVPAPDGQPHIAKGMAFPFTVKAGEAGAKAELPEADVEVEGKDFSYSSVPTFEEGETTVAFKNSGTQDHEITVVELEAGKTAADIGAFFASPKGPPPFEMLGGVAVKAGASGTTTFDLEKGGNYVFACLIPDPKDQQPHIAKGMSTKVTVT